MNVTVTLFNTKKKARNKKLSETAMNGVKTESGFCSKTFFSYIFHLISIVRVKKAKKICVFFFSFLIEKMEICSVLFLYPVFEQDVASEQGMCVFLYG